MTLLAQVTLGLGALRLEVALEAGAGEVVAVLGPNGAGKTSLLRALAGLLPLRGGHVELGGRVLDDPGRGIAVPPEGRAVGMVFQDYLLFPHLSVTDNVAFGLRARGVGRREARQRAEVELDRVGLAGVSRRRPGALSGGQAQRVALARALAVDPSLLLLDEPLAALDATARLTLRRELRAHLDAFPGPCLIVTHDAIEAMALADRLVVLEAGRVVQEGTPSEISRRPRSEWVAGFVGLNLYRGASRGDRVELDGGAVLVASHGPPDGPVFAVVHPRAVALHRSRPEGSPRNVWQGTIEALEARSDQVRATVRGPFTIVAEITPAAVADLDLGRGGPVWVSVKASEVQRYPA